MPTAADIYASVFADPAYSPDDQLLARYWWALSVIRAVSPWARGGYQHKPPCAPYRVMDVGAGRGTFLRMASEAFPGVTLDAADIRNFMKHSGAFTFIELAENGDWPFSRQWDCVTCLDVLEHFSCHKYAENAIVSMARAAPYAAITVANHSDAQRGVELHAIQEPRGFWDDLISRHFRVVHTADFFGSTMFAYFLSAR